MFVEGIANSLGKIPSACSLIDSSCAECQGVLDTAGAVCAQAGIGNKKRVVPITKSNAPRLIPDISGRDETKVGRVGFMGGDAGSHENCTEDTIIWSTLSANDGRTRLFHARNPVDRKCQTQGSPRECARIEPFDGMRCEDDIGLIENDQPRHHRLRSRSTRRFTLLLEQAIKFDHFRATGVIDLQDLQTVSPLCPCTDHRNSRS